jgi:hypothetical protein
MPPAATPPVDAFRAAQSVQLNRAAVELQKEVLSASFNQAQAYTNIVLGAGYAGFFAVWAFTREQLTAPQALWSALLVAISLLSFVLFEVYKARYVSRLLLTLSNTLNDETRFLPALAEWKRQQQAHDLRFGVIWAKTFWFALSTGVAGGLILLYAFVQALLRWYFPG